jgi:hypothetical protein
MNKIHTGKAFEELLTYVNPEQSKIKQQLTAICLMT